MTPVHSRKSSSRPRVDPYFDQGKLYAVQLMLMARLDELLSELGVRLYRSKKMCHGCCPIHGGDNPGALNLYLEGDTVPGYWKCNTQGCHLSFRRTIIGFVRGVLSHHNHGWAALRDRDRRAKQKTVSWKEAVDYCCRFLGTDINSIRVNYDELDRRRFAGNVANLTKRPEGRAAGLSRFTVRQHLRLPSAYFLRRGYSREVLDRYDVGEYPGLVGKDGRPHPLAHRVAVPVYDSDGKFAAGFTGRSVFHQCDLCKRWHSRDEPCPQKGDRNAWARTAKWYNHGFQKESHLYNYWFAKDAIREQGLVVVVEGPGDVWRLEEAGIRCAVALFGVELSDEQQVMLEMSGAMNVVVLTDTDSAGDGAREQLKRRLCRSFRLHFPKLSSHDIGEMSVQQVKDEVLPHLEAIILRGY